LRDLEAIHVFEMLSRRNSLADASPVFVLGKNSRRVHFEGKERKKGCVKV
jgi:hypothetical protein